MPSTSKDIDLELALGPDSPERLTWPGFLEDVAERFGPRVALRFEGVDVRYAELAASARGLAKALLEVGVKKGDIIGLLYGFFDRVIHVIWPNPVLEGILPEILTGR